MNDLDTSNRYRLRSVGLPNNGLAEVWFELRGDHVEMHVTQKTLENSGESSSNWLRCSYTNCTGEAIPQGGMCYPHSSEAQRKDYLDRVHVTKERLSLRGANVTQEVWNEITASSAFVSGRPVVPISLIGAEVSACIEFHDCELEFFVEISCASIFKHMSIRQCVFHSFFNARHTIFDGGPPSFNQCTFKENVDVSFAQVRRVSLGFERCIFERSMLADGFSGGGLILTGSVIQGNISLGDSSAHLILDDASVEGTVNLRHSDCIGVSGQGLRLKAADRLGPFAAGSVQLTRARFGSRILIDVKSPRVDLVGAAFTEGGLILAHGAELSLEQVRLGGPLQVTGVAGTTEKTQVLSLRNADAGSMSFAQLDLSRCSFQEVHGLATFDIQANVFFASTPWWAGKRRFLADEFAWRIDSGCLHKLGWKLPGVHVGSLLPERSPDSVELVLLSPVEADQVAVIYRQLRHSLEGKSNMPGAADFYYGEMEMRRWSSGRPPLERILVWCYWLISGYGLRVGRAILAWLLLVTLGTWGLIRVGIKPEPPLSQALLSAIRAAIPGFPTHLSLSQSGLWIETGLRVFGAIFIGMFFLSVRSMVMRKPSE